MYNRSIVEIARQYNTNSMGTEMSINILYICDYAGNISYIEFS